jgi:hypothetical protein
MASWQFWNASPCCFKLFEHCDRLADSRAACTAGSKRPTRVPMIAMTTRSSTRVKPDRFDVRMENTFDTQDEKMKKIIEEKASLAIDLRHHAVAIPHGIGSQSPLPRNSS